MMALLDLNILIDYFTKREPFFNFSNKIIELCISNQIEGLIASHSILNMHCILRKHFSIQDRATLLLSLFSVFTIVNVDNQKIISALENSDFQDSEDCLQAECAEFFNADYIITRNTKDFIKSPIPALTPEEFLKAYF